MGDHRRPSMPGRHRRPGAPKRAAAMTATFATGTAVTGAIVITSHSAHAAPQAILPMARPAAQAVALVPHFRASQASWVAVRKGDTLSGIAWQDCGNEADWPGIYERNRKTIGPDYNLIQPGQQLALNCRALPLPRAVTAGYVRPAEPRDNVQSARPAVSSPVVTSGFQACVIARESGGNPGAVNPRSGAGGLYQFLPSTWAALGFPGLPEDAPVWMQDEAFRKAYAESGTSPWRPYDGC